MAEQEGRTIDLVICDKSPLVQAGLRQLFGGDPRFSLIAVAADGERFMEAVARLRFDVGIIGWDMPSLNGRGVLEALRERGAAPRIVVYTGNAGSEIPRQAVQLGAAGYCSKAEPLTRLVETVLAVAEGRMMFPFMDMREAAKDPFADLTQRERELLAELARGRTNAQLARDIGISLNTVKFHLKNLYEKLDVRNRAQAVAWYLRSNGGHG